MSKFKVGDKVIYKGEECEIDSFDDDGYVNLKYIEIDYALAHEKDLTPVVKEEMI